jgi:hypothetical protein
MREFTNQHKNQGGNALFLILIAVVLFAALTYAITQSNRGSGNSSAREGNSVGASSVTQFPAAVRTGVTRILMRGFGVADLVYSRPTDGASYTAPTAPVTTQQLVFHPDGGGVTFTPPDDQAVTSLANATWVINSNAGTTVEGVGTATGDHVMFLTDVKGGVCQQIMNQLYGQGAAITAHPSTRAQIIGTYAPATGLANNNAIALTAANGMGAAGRAFGCFTTAAPVVNVYYHVLVEQ